MKATGLCFLCFFLVFPFSVQGQEITANNLHKGCSMLAGEESYHSSLDEGKEIFIGHCGGMLEGISEMIGLYAETDAPAVACLPKGIVITDLAKVVSDFMDKNREHWDKSPVVLMIVALKNKFPCRD